MGGGAAGQTAQPNDGSAADATSGRMQAVYMTFYGWPDNRPPGRAIAYQSGGFHVHNAAGGTGSYADPITFATDPVSWPTGRSSSLRSSRST